MPKDKGLGPEWSHEHMMAKIMVTEKVYIAGPMRGIPVWNFQAFDSARDRLLKLGYEVISPADIDRQEWGGDPLTNRELLQRLESEVAAWGLEEIREVARRDLLAILECDALALLPGWEMSTGSRAEYFLAKWLGLPILNALTGKPFEGPRCAVSAQTTTRFFQDLFGDYPYASNSCYS